MKLRALESFQLLRSSPGATTQSALEDWQVLYPGIPPNTVLSWQNSERQLRDAAHSPSPRVRQASLYEKGLESRRIAQFPVEEAEVYDEFVLRRKDGLPCRGIWFVVTMKQRLAANKPHGWESFKHSDGWFNRFLTRMHLSLRVATNVAKLTVAERVPRCLKYFQYVQELSASHRRLRRQQVRLLVFLQFLQSQSSNIWGAKKLLFVHLVVLLWTTKPQNNSFVAHRMLEN